MPSNASGVRVRTRLEVPVFFMRVVNAVFRDPNKVLWAKGYAKARVMIPTKLPADGPFILCGSAAWGVKDAAGASLGNPGASIALLDGSDQIKPQYVGYTFRIHDSQISNGNSGSVRYDAGCKTKSGADGARWNGLAGGLGADNAGKTAPGWFKYDYGTEAGPVRTAVAGAEGCAAGGDLALQLRHVPADRQEQPHAARPAGDLHRRLRPVPGHPERQPPARRQAARRLHHRRPAAATAGPGTTPGAVTVKLVW